MARIDFAALPYESIAGCISPAGIDLTDKTAADAAVAEVIRQLGGIDVQVDIAGVCLGNGRAGFDDQLGKMFSMKLISNVTMSMGAFPAINVSDASRINNIGAGAANHAALGMGAYAASKAGIDRKTEAFAAELSDNGTMLNAILPSVIDAQANCAEMPYAAPAEWVKPAGDCGSNFVSRILGSPGDYRYADPCHVRQFGIA